MLMGGRTGIEPARPAPQAGALPLSYRPTYGHLHLKLVTEGGLNTLSHVPLFNRLLIFIWISLARLSSIIITSCMLKLSLILGTGDRI